MNPISPWRRRTAVCALLLALEAALSAAGVAVIRPGQYMDKWLLDHAGIRPIENRAVKQALGFPPVQQFP